MAARWLSGKSFQFWHDKADDEKKGGDLDELVRLKKQKLGQRPIENSPGKKETMALSVGEGLLKNLQKKEDLDAGQIEQLALYRRFFNDKAWGGSKSAVLVLYSVRSELGPCYEPLSLKKVCLEVMGENSFWDRPKLLKFHTGAKEIYLRALIEDALIQYQVFKVKGPESFDSYSVILSAILARPEKSADFFTAYLEKPEKISLSKFWKQKRENSVQRDAGQWTSIFFQSLAAPEPHSLKGVFQHFHQIENALRTWTRLADGEGKEWALKTLDIRGSLDSKTLTKCFKKMALKFHPDRMEKTHIPERLQEQYLGIASHNYLLIQKAYDVLKSTLKK